MQAKRTSRAMAALCGMIVYDMVIALCGFRSVYRLIKNYHVRVGKGASVSEIVAAVELATRWYPRSALCLQRSAVLTWLLRREGVPAQMILGMRQMPLAGHAWVEVAGAVVNDDRCVTEQYDAIDNM